MLLPVILLMLGLGEIIQQSNSSSNNCLNCYYLFAFIHSFIHCDRQTEKESPSASASASPPSLTEKRKKGKDSYRLDRDLSEDQDLEDNNDNDNNNHHNNNQNETSWLNFGSGRVRPIRYRCIVTIILCNYFLSLSHLFIALVHT